MTTFWAKMTLYNLAQQGKIGKDCAEHFIREISKRETLASLKKTRDWAGDAYYTDTITTIESVTDIEDIINNLYGAYQKQIIDKIPNKERLNYVVNNLWQILAFYKLINDPVMKFKLEDENTVYLPDLLCIDINKYKSKVMCDFDVEKFNINNIEELNCFFETKNRNTPLNVLYAIKDVRNYLKNERFGNYDIYQKLDELFNKLYKTLDEEDVKDFEIIISHEKVAI